MVKLMNGKVMFKPIIIKVIMEKLMIIALIMARPTKNYKKLFLKKTMTKLIMVQLTISK
jgi:hypothetical protein